MFPSTLRELLQVKLRISINMDWTTPLRSLQADFIQRLKSGHLLHSESPGTHSELTVISGERLDQLRDFCWDMAEKFRYKSNSRVRDVFVNNMKGKLGEEVVKARLGDLVTEVDYEKRMGGDGKVDFTLASNPDIGIQVKARHGDAENVRWSISREEVEKNAVLVCVLIQEEVSEAQTEYHLVLAGFLPTKMIEAGSGRVSFGIEELLYGGGVKNCLENPSDALSLAELYYYRGDYDKAIKYCDRVLRTNPDSTVAYFWRGMAYLAKKNYQRALNSLNLAIQLNPQNILAYTYRGMTYNALKDEQNSRNDYEKALSFEPENAEDHRGHGAVYYCLKNYQEAIKCFAQAIEINPSHALAYNNRGVAYKNMGNFQQALQDYEKAAELSQQAGDQDLYQMAIRNKDRLS